MDLSTKDVLLLLGAIELVACVGCALYWLLGRGSEARPARRAGVRGGGGRVVRRRAAREQDAGETTRLGATAGSDAGDTTRLGGTGSAPGGRTGRGPIDTAAAGRVDIGSIEAAASGRVHLGAIVPAPSDRTRVVTGDTTHAGPAATDPVRSGASGTPRSFSLDPGDVIPLHFPSPQKHSEVPADGDDDLADTGRHHVPDGLLQSPTYRLTADRRARAKVPGIPDSLSYQIPGQGRPAAGGRRGAAPDDVSMHS